MTAPKIKYLRDYPLSGVLVKHFDKAELVAKCEVPKEWLNLEIVHTYTKRMYSGKLVRVLVVK